MSVIRLFLSRLLLTSRRSSLIQKFAARSPALYTKFRRELELDHFVEYRCGNDPVPVFLKIDMAPSQRLTRLTHDPTPLRLGPRAERIWDRWRASWKSSLAFDTLYAEGQRRYVESLSAYARQFLDQMEKPNVDFIEGLSPAIAIEQRSAGANPRSTIATTTETYDYLRVLYSAVGQPHDPFTGHPLKRQTPQQIVDPLLANEPQT